MGIDKDSIFNYLVQVKNQRGRNFCFNNHILCRHFESKIFQESSRNQGHERTNVAKRPILVLAYMQGMQQIQKKDDVLVSDVERRWLKILELKIIKVAPKNSKSEKWKYSWKTLWRINFSFSNTGRSTSRRATIRESIFCSRNILTYLYKLNKLTPNMIMIRPTPFNQVNGSWK